MNALVNLDELPLFRDVEPQEIDQRLAALIARRDGVVDTVIAQSSRRFADVWPALEQAGLAIDEIWSPVAHLEAVIGSDAQRACVARNRPVLTAAGMRVAHNEALASLFEAIAADAEFAELTEEDRVAVERALQHARLSGVHLPADKKARLSENGVALGKLQHEFSVAVLEATQSWSEHIADESLLAGIPDSEKAILADYAKAAGRDGWIINLQPAAINAVLMFAEDRQLRLRVYTAQTTRASDQGPQAGSHDNGPRLREILALRRENAALLGFAHPVEQTLVLRMAESYDAITAFLRDLAARARPTAERQLEEVRRFAAEELDIADLQLWDLPFAMERLRRARYALNEAEIRQYFPVDQVLSGWRELLGDVYGLTLVPRPEVDVWHPDVIYYEVVDRDGRTISGLYLDLHARLGKRAGAWMSVAVAPRADRAPGLPVAYLVCNFPPPDEHARALLSHADVKTLLHETGHCLHLLLTDVNRSSLAGTNVEWDAVEFPSQLMEEFAWDRRVVERMSRHVMTAESLPAALFERMCAARTFGSALNLLSQVEMGLFDIMLHGPEPSDDAFSLLERVRDEVSIMRPPNWNRFPCVFAHIFAGGYAVGYYSYLWAELLAADGFARFAEDGTISAAVGEDFRREVLSRGGVRPSNVNFAAFRGRGPEFAPLLRRYGLTTGDEAGRDEPGDRQLRADGEMRWQRRRTAP